MAENKAFESIMKGLSESLEYAKSDNSKARRMRVTVAELPKFHDKEIRQIRENLNLTQKKFCIRTRYFTQNSRSVGVRQ